MAKVALDAKMIVERHEKGETLREIADSLGVSHQRIHQIIKKAQVLAKQNQLYGEITTEKIKKLREKMGLTQEKFANAIGVTVFTIYRWERKGGSPRSTVILRRLKELMILHRIK